MSIFGVDIASGSPGSRRDPSYSLVILEGDATALHHMISRHKLIRMIRERQPEMVAMDNVHELAQSHKDCLVYTSDAADDVPCVDLRARRIIKKT